MMKPALGLAILVLFGSPTAPAEDLPRSTPGTGDRGRALFQGQVRKLLSETCVRCHNPDQKKGGLDLTRHAGAVKGGASGPAVDIDHPADSLLLEKIESGEMPPKAQLSEPQVQAIRGWVASGAPYADEPVTPPRAGADWWSLQPIRRPPVPVSGPSLRGRVRNRGPASG